MIAVAVPIGRDLFSNANACSAGKADSRHTSAGGAGTRSRSCSGRRNPRHLFCGVCPGCCERAVPKACDMRSGPRFVTNFCRQFISR